MKKILFFIILAFILMSCSKDDDAPDTNIPAIEMFSFKEYIDDDSLITDYGSEGIDTTTFWINGRKNNKLWIGIYNKQTKKEILT